MMGQILTNELLIKQLKIQSLVAQKQKKESNVKWTIVEGGLRKVSAELEKSTE